MREPVSSTAINRDIPDLTSRRNIWYDKLLCAWKKVNSNSLFCISKYIIVDQNHISNPSHITLRSIVCIEIISTHSSVGLHGSVHSWKDRTRITPLTTHLLPDSESRLAITIEPALIIMGSIFKDYQDSERNCEPQLLPCLSQGEKKVNSNSLFCISKYIIKSQLLWLSC